MPLVRPAGPASPSQASASVPKTDPRIAGPSSRTNPGATPQGPVPGRSGTLTGLEQTADARDEVRALVRLMIKKGVFTKDEFLKELQEILLY